MTAVPKTDFPCQGLNDLKRGHAKKLLKTYPDIPTLHGLYESHNVRALVTDFSKLLWTLDGFFSCKMMPGWKVRRLVGVSKTKTKIVMYSCARCSRRFDRPARAIDHLLLHESVLRLGGDDQKTLTCSKCSSSLDSNKEALDHLASVHGLVFDAVDNETSGPKCDRDWDLDGNLARIANTINKSTAANDNNSTNANHDDRAVANETENDDVLEEKEAETPASPTVTESDSSFASSPSTILFDESSLSTTAWHTNPHKRRSVDDLDDSSCDASDIGNPVHERLCKRTRTCDASDSASALVPDIMDMIERGCITDPIGADNDLPVVDPSLAWVSDYISLPQDSSNDFAELLAFTSPHNTNSAFLSSTV